MASDSADIVITYVDNDDPEWRKIAVQYKNVASNVVRYRSYKTLKHQIKLMLKFMPFIKNIFVVVSQESQIPDEMKNIPNVVFVTHSQIIPKKYLPVFNSCAIEMFLHRIPGLQEHFIYFNDDMFIVNNCKFEDFFEDEKPVINVKYSELDSVKNMFGQQCVNSFQFACGGLGRQADNGRFFKPAHCPSPMFKSDCEELYGKLEQYILMSLSKTRDAKNLNQYMYVDYSVMKRSNIEQKKGFFKYLTLDEQFDKNSMPCEICVNDMNKSVSFEDDISKFKEQLVQLYCEQSSIVRENTFSLSLEDLFKYAYVISIDPERLQLMQKIFEHHGLPMPKLFEGFQLKHVRRYEIVPEVNCQYSHLALIKMAKTFDWPFICIFEDDAYPCYDVKEKLESYLVNIPVDCECLVLGNVYVKSSGHVRNNMFRISFLHGAHAYIVFKSGYDKLIASYNDIGKCADRLVANTQAYSPKMNLFIQYSKEKSMHGFSSYVWEKRNDEQIFKEFPKIENVIHNKKTFIKFIIPAYNAEKTLPKMLDSILNQTFQDFKVIVVDDVSADNTWNVISDYQQKYPDKIIGIKSKEKTYAGGARNLGIAYQLESTYTWFVDADDWLNGNDVLQIIYDEWKSTNADVFCIDCNRWTYRNWPAPWWRILKSEFVCEFQPNLKTCNDVGNYHLVKNKIKGKKLVRIQKKPLYCYSKSHNTERVNHMHEIREWIEIMQKQINKT